MFEKSHAWFKKLSEVSREGIFIHRQGLLLKGNSQFFKMIGYTEAELLGKQLIEKTIAPESREEIKKNIASGRTELYKVIGLRKDGQKFPLYMAAEVEYQGESARIVSAIDLSKERLIQDELYLSNWMKEHMAGGINLIRVSDSIIVYTNPGYEKMFSYEPGELAWVWRSAEK
ncbi:PAS domain S-box protein [Candidatus Riflebacteria bacterium]